jgi:hypothetical protein
VTHLLDVLRVDEGELEVEAPGDVEKVRMVDACGLDHHAHLLVTVGGGQLLDRGERLGDRFAAILDVPLGHRTGT